MRGDNRPCERFESDWELASLGALDDEQILAMQTHIESGCAVCSERFLHAQMCVSAIGADLPEERLSPRFEQRLRDRIGAKDAIVQAPLRRFGVHTVPWLVAAAALAAVVWLGVERARLTSGLDQARKTALALPTPQPPVVPGLNPAPVLSQNTKIMQARIEELQRQVDQLNATARQGPAAQPPQQTEQLRQDLAEANARTRELEQRLRDAQSRIQDLSVAREAARQQEAPPAALSDLQELRRTAAALTLELARKDAELQSQSRQVAELRSLLRLLQSSPLRYVELRPSDQAAQNSTGRVLISPSGVLVLARRLPKIPDGKCFQLWLIRKGNPSIVSGGLLEIDGQGSGILLSPSTSALGQVTGFAITDEPAGGSAKAQGHKLLFGAL